MDTLFDNLARAVAGALPRRRALGLLAGALLAALFPARSEAGPVTGGSCEGKCKFKITVEYDYQKDGDKLALSRFKFKIHDTPDRSQGNCKGDLGKGEGKIDFKEKDKKPCLIHDFSSFADSPKNCGTTVEGVSVLEKKDADFEWIHIDVTHDIECCPNGDCKDQEATGECEGDCTKDTFRIRFDFEGGKIKQTGTESGDKGDSGTRTVTYEKEIPCKGTCKRS